MADDDRPVGPVIVRRRLGNELRRLREDANLRLDAVAAELEVSPSKISRIETGHSTAKTWDVRNLLELYGVADAARRDEILGWTSDAKVQSWWQTEIAIGPETLDYYISLEAEAARVQCYCTPVLHALLQTDDYARAHIGALLPDASRIAVQEYLGVRLRRQTAILGQGSAFRFVAVIDEAVLLRTLGSTSVMAGQLEALLDHPDNVELRVRPLAASPHRATLSPFTIFTPRVADLDPVVVAVEAAMTDTYLDRAEDVADFQTAFQSLHDTSLDESASLDLIRSLIA